MVCDGLLTHFIIHVTCSTNTYANYGPLLVLVTNDATELSRPGSGQLARDCNARAQIIHSRIIIILLQVHGGPEGAGRKWRNESAHVLRLPLVLGHLHLIGIHFFLPSDTRTKGTNPAKNILRTGNSYVVPVCNLFYDFWSNPPPRLPQECVHSIPITYTFFSSLTH